MMKFYAEKTNKGIQIPEAAVKLCGFESGNKMEFHAGENALVVLKGKMTAMELIQAIEQLEELTVDLTAHLVRTCGPCHNCMEGECTFRNWESTCVRIPEDLREEAGIPRDARLIGLPDEDSGCVIVSEADYDHDLSDVPSGLRELLIGTNVCFGELDELITEEKTVYGD